MAALPAILHLVTDLRIGGTQRILLDRVREPSPFRHEVLVFSEHTGRHGGPDLAAEFARAGARVRTLGARTAGDLARAWRSGRLLPRVDEILREIRPDILHSTLFHTHLLGALLAARAGIPHIASKEGTDDWMGPLERPLEGLALRRADRVAAVSEATRRAALAAGVQPERIRVIPNGIDLAHPGSWRIPDDGETLGAPFEGPVGTAFVTPFEEPLGEPVGKPVGEPVGKQLGKPHGKPGAPRLLGVGRLERVKGWEDLLAATARLASQGRRVRLDLLGAGSLARDLREQAARLGIGEWVRFHAPQSGDTDPAVHAGAPAAPGEPAESAAPETILVVPSREEGFGLILLEGMARGLPIVATRAGGIPELARDDTEAILVAPRDPGALAAAILRLIEDPRLATRLAQAGRKRAIEFPKNIMVRGYHDLYQEVLGSRQSASGDA